MSQASCPGAKFLRQPKPEIFRCPGCGGEVEIWSDEFSRTCPSCGRVVLREGGLSCLEWCAMGRECVGEAAFDSFNEFRAASIRERLLKVAEEAAAGTGLSDRIEKSLHYAEIIAQGEKADLHVTLAATVLSLAFKGQPGRAREELLKIGFQLDDVDEVCRMVEAEDGDTRDGKASVNYAVVHDARLLAGKGGSANDAAACLTATGARLAG